MRGEVFNYKLNLFFKKWKYESGFVQIFNPFERKVITGDYSIEDYALKEIDNNIFLINCELLFNCQLNDDFLQNISNSSFKIKSKNLKLPKYNLINIKTPNSSLKKILTIINNNPQEDYYNLQPLQGCYNDLIFLNNPKESLASQQFLKIKNIDFENILYKNSVYKKFNKVYIFDFKEKLKLKTQIEKQIYKSYIINIIFSRFALYYDYILLIDEADPLPKNDIEFLYKNKPQLDSKNLSVSYKDSNLVILFSVPQLLQLLPVYTGINDPTFKYILEPWQEILQKKCEYSGFTQFKI